MSEQPALPPQRPSKPFVLLQGAEYHEVVDARKNTTRKKIVLGVIIAIIVVAGWIYRHEIMGFLRHYFVIGPTDYDTNP
jgi:hypothetical protein